MAETTLKIYDGEKQIVDAVYCRNKEKGELGWYDYVNEKFHPTPPPKINETGIDTGVQYIDTGYIPASLRPKGEWISVKNPQWPAYSHDKCNICGWWNTKNALCYDGNKKPGHSLNYCPNCGADMRGNPHDS